MSLALVSWIGRSAGSCEWPSSKSTSDPTYERIKRKIKFVATVYTRRRFKQRAAVFPIAEAPIGVLQFGERGSKALKTFRKLNLGNEVRGYSIWC